MAIKYKTFTGQKHLNEIARLKANIFKLQLKGLRCPNKHTEDTIIRFEQSGSNYVTHLIDSCCPDFKSILEQRIKQTMM